jgi:hypothetical protein
VKRRKFISGISATAAGTVFMPAAIRAGTPFPGRERDVPQKLRGFIVSDAHFGWAHENQPAPAFQQKMMDRIMERFPGLDVFFDTGDAHHNDHHDNADPHLARENWCDIIQGGCGQVPFHYVIGNHEIRSNEDGDPEGRGCVMGSTSCRPYYSFDMMGIHFISLPELIRAIYITEEEFAWLQLDLEVNRERTTILLSHNNILGTTSGNEAGYRGLPDSERLMGIFREYPNIIAWMHGHNHNYEIVRRDGMLFVSNGRIGGFDPSRGKHGLGGIYFEIGRDGMKVRGYSAEKDIFLDELSGALSAELHKPTTFDPRAPYSYSYGTGGAVDRQRIPVYNHHCGRDQQREVYLAGCNGETINEDPGLERYVERPAWHGLDKILMAGRVNHGNSVFEFAGPGIRLKRNTDWWTTLTVPGDFNERYSYYRCPPATEYKVSVKLTSYPEKKGGKQALWLRLLIHDTGGRLLRIVQTEDIDIVEGEQVHEALLEVPALEDFETIYTDPASEILLNIALEASFSGMEKGDVEISRISFSPAGAAGPTVDPALSVNGMEAGYKGEITGRNIVRLPVDAPVRDRDMMEMAASGSRRVTFLVRHANLEWQVRNACVEDHGKFLEIKNLRNKLSRRNEIIIVPLAGTREPYIGRIYGAEGIRIFPLSRGHEALGIDTGEIRPGARLKVFNAPEPALVTGTSSWSFENNTIMADIENPGMIEFHF